MTTVLVHKPWGSEVILVNNELYCGKILTIYQDKRLSLQYHKKKQETIYILSGKIRLEYDDNGKMYVEDLDCGEVRTIKPMVTHRMTALTNSAEVIEISTPHSDDDTVRLEDDFGRL